MKKRFLLSFLLILVVSFIGCIDKNPETKQRKPAFDLSPAPQASGQAKQEIVKSMIVQRGHDGIRDGFKNDSLDKLKSYGIVLDMKNLLWLATRGAAGIEAEGEKKAVAEFSVIAESEESLAGDTVNSDNCWIRLNYEAYFPDQGVNVWEHKDLIIYIDPDNADDAFLGVQDPQEQMLWTVFRLPGYGTWLEKEIDMLLRLTTGL
jgi:hypothetical protein